MTGESEPTSERVRLKRRHERGSYDRAAIDAILDASPLAHVAYVHEGSPYVTPTLQWREGGHIYWHGSAASRMIKAAEGAEVCVTVSLLDGFVMGRSAMHHSVNYRSVMIFGKPEAVTDPAEKEARLKAFFDHLFPGRWETLRPMTAQELKATGILSLPISEASAKVRDAPPVDDEEDYAHDVWAGVLPVRMMVGEAEDDPRLKPGITLPEALARFRLG
jgi:nitroimidazol reductase NimA-like FMN-containing flavoprotein (pyridoxamine 5'-phosphate oxidase superfamily)